MLQERTITRPALQKPTFYNVVLRQRPHVVEGKGTIYFPATTQTLRQVFHMDRPASHEHAAEAARTGRSSILQTTWDVAQTKAMTANEILRLRAAGNPHIFEREVQFVLERSSG